MKLVKIPKKTKGQFREICVPTKEEKIQFSSFLPELNRKASVLCDKETVHGFMNGKNPVTNAKKHIGKRYTLRFDLSDFFDTVKTLHLKGKLTVSEIEALMPDGRAYQGLPTSPIVANIAAIDMDKAIIKKLKTKEGIVYTRYADDLTFSFDDYSFVEFLKKEIQIIVGRCGFRLNPKKTWLQDAKFGNRIITGVCVTNDGIKPTRAIKRKIRAAAHQNKINQLKGLVEWSKLKEPNTEKKEKDITQEKINELANLWNLRKIDLKQIPFKKTEDLGDDVIISGDPVQILGLSNWTTNWRSCMMHPNGQYHRGATFWLYLEGTRIAGLKSGKSMTVAGFTRPTFAARTLIHEDENGNLYYDRIYGESYDISHKLQNKLESCGISFIRNRKKRTHIKGRVKKSKSIQPYFDSLSHEEIVENKKKFYRAY